MCLKFSALISRHVLESRVALGTRFQTYGLLTKREIKMAGYWPTCLCTETQSRLINTQKNEVNIQITSLVNKGLK